MPVFLVWWSTALGWVKKYPKQILELWFIGWAVFLYTSWLHSGAVAALHILVTGTLSLTSLVGLPLPVVVALVNSGWLQQQSYDVPTTSSSSLRQTVTQVHGAYANLKQVESDRYLGLDVDLVDAQDRFLNAATILLQALDAQALV